MLQPGAVLDPHRNTRGNRRLPQGIQHLPAAQQNGLSQPERFAARKSAQLRLAYGLPTPEVDNPTTTN